MNTETESIPRNTQLKTEARPFLKWAGGKSQLLKDLTSRLPAEIKASGRIARYVEPFVGGGAFFFHLINNFRIDKSFLFDINRELIIGYKVIKKNPEELIGKLTRIQNKYLRRKDSNREKMYYQMRDKYNKQIYKFNFSEYSECWIERASLLIFLNKTCYNGLFRQNQKGEFNVPFGRYKNPNICDSHNIIEVSKVLQKTEIICGDFKKSKKYIRKNSLVYFDPPYRPISNTSHFTGYFKDSFNNNDQKRLANLYKQMDKKGAYLLLSNSDPKNFNTDDNFFDDLYSEFIIERVAAKRFINCDADKRGEISELIIRNYNA